MSVALFRATSLGVSSAAATLSSAAVSSGEAALPLMAAMTLSEFCSFLSSVRTTSLSPATGAHPPEAALLAGAWVPEEPALPQPAARPAVARRPTRPRATRETFCILCCPPSVSRRDPLVTPRVRRTVRSRRPPCRVQLNISRGPRQPHSLCRCQPFTHLRPSHRPCACLHC